MKLKQTSRNGGYMTAEVEVKRDHGNERRHTPTGELLKATDFVPQAPVYNGGSFSYVIEICNRYEKS